MSTEQIERRGFCPTQETDYQITVTHVKIDSFTSNERQKVKTGFKCDYMNGDKSKCSFANSCPIFNASPDQF